MCIHISQPYITQELYPFKKKEKTNEERKPYLRPTRSLDLDRVMLKMYLEYRKENLKETLFLPSYFRNLSQSVFCVRRKISHKLIFVPRTVLVTDFVLYNQRIGGDIDVRQ